MLQLVSLLLLSIITSRLLEKKHKVAYIAHSVFFVFMLFTFMVSTDISFIKNVMIEWLGVKNYNPLYEAINETFYFVNLSISAVLILEVVIFVLIPLLSILAFIQEIRDQFKEMKVKVDFSSFIKTFITLVNDPTKDFRHTQDETYLILGKLLN